MRHFRSQLLVLAALLALASPLAADMYVDHLRSLGIDPSANGIAKYLTQMTPTAEQQKQIDALIAQLGADSFEKREAAEAALIAMPVPPRAALIEATKSKDAEIAYRAARVLKRIATDDQRTMLALLKVIERQQHKGLAKPLAPALRFVNDDEQRWTAVRAMMETAQPDDAALLTELAKHKHALTRAAAARALGKTIGDDSAATLKSLLDDDDEFVRYHAARALGDIGDRASLPAFVKLLEAKDSNIRWRAIRALQWLTRRSFDYVSGEDPASQKESIANIAAWIENNAAAVDLRFPIEVPEKLVLFNGEDLAGWQAVIDGKRAGPGDVWKVQNGAIRATGNGRGYLRSTRAFINYELQLEWRWPNGKTGDSGVWLLLDGPDAAMPKCLEAQLQANNAGDFWLVGGFTCTVNGQPQTRFVKRTGADSENKPDEWNRMTIRIQRGTVTVKVNDVLQNTATDCPKGPGKFGLQAEGDAIEFRNITVQPLDD